MLFVTRAGSGREAYSGRKDHSVTGNVFVKQIPMLFGCINIMKSIGLCLHKTFEQAANSCKYFFELRDTPPEVFPSSKDSIFMILFDAISKYLCSS
jgi:hypothetical protein